MARHGVRAAWRLASTLPASVGRGGDVHGDEAGQDGVEPGEGEHVGQTAVGHHDPQLPAPGPRPSLGPDEQAEAHRVADRQAREVDHHDLTGVVDDEADEVFTAPGDGGQVELTAERQDGDPGMLIPMADQVHGRANLAVEMAIDLDPAHSGAHADPIAAAECLLAGLDDPVAGPGTGERRLVHLHRLPGRPARYAEPAMPVRPDVWRAFGRPGLWTHQAAAIDRVRAGASVVVATGTASGKSLCYQVPIAEAVTATPGGTALLVFPTKALAQDQLLKLIGLDLPGLTAATYDGDTSPEDRAWVRRQANVVLTNPEMLHGALLPYHGRWAEFLARLRYVVVDELHVLRGVFGSHTGHVLRRLRRVAARYGAEPAFVFSSATIGEPARLASDLCGLPVEAITDDGSPRGERLLALWNPPLLDADRGIRASAHRETARVVSALVAGGWRTVGFTRSRRGTEVVAADVRRRLREGAGDGGAAPGRGGGQGPGSGPALELAERVRAYRAGYLPAERRQLEADLFAGRLRGVVATSALELGVDVGGLDACVLDGFPGTIASMWQQVGRAGRAHDGAVAVLVAGADQLDQWLMAHPGEVVSRPPEPAVVNLANPWVLVPQLACAAYEAPLAPDDEVYWGDLLDDGVRHLVLEDRVKLRRGRAYWCGRGSPAPGLGLRSGAQDEFRIAEADGWQVGTVNGARALEAVHPGAIYLHQGQQYRVHQLDLVERVAVVAPVDTDEYTMARSELTVRVFGADHHRRVGRAEAAVGSLEVVSHVVGYERRDGRTREVLGREPLDLPPARLVTRGLWYTVDDAVLARARLDTGRLLGSLHALEHAAIGILPLFTICDRWDVGGVSTAWQADTERPTVVIYDGYPGGIGIADLAFAAAERHLAATRAVIERCRCHRGCPSCVQSPKCGNGNEPLDKPGALALLRAILG